jgi:hypothetical protein
LPAAWSALRRGLVGSVRAAVPDDLLYAPDDAAFAAVDEFAPGVDAVFADERVRVLRADGVGVGDVDRGAGPGAGGVLDCARA